MSTLTDHEQRQLDIETGLALDRVAEAEIRADNALIDAAFADPALPNAVLRRSDRKPASNSSIFFFIGGVVSEVSTNPITP